MGKINKITIKILKDTESEAQNLAVKDDATSNSKILAVKNITKNKQTRTQNKNKAKNQKTLTPPNPQLIAKEKIYASFLLQDTVDKYQKDILQHLNLKQNHINDKENIQSKETSIEYITIEEEASQEQPSFTPCPICETYQVITKEQMIAHIRGTHKIKGSWLNNMIM